MAKAEQVEQVMKLGFANPSLQDVYPNASCISDSEGPSGILLVPAFGVVDYAWWTKTCCQQLRQDGHGNPGGLYSIRPSRC